MECFYVVISRSGSQQRLKLFLDEEAWRGGPYGEFFLVLDTEKGTVTFECKEPTYAEALTWSFNQTMQGNRE